LIMVKRIFLLLFAVLLSIPTSSQAGVPGFMKYRMGTLEGQVFFDNKPVVSPLVAFFDVSKGLPPVPGASGRIPEFLGRADSKGRFKVKLVQGSYYLGILLRPFEDRPGPPRPGEKFYFANDGQGKLRKLAIEDFKEIDVGRIDSSLPEVFQETEDSFIVEGTVYKEEGEEPFEGAMVMGKKTPTMRRPQYFSKRTGKDGKFSIKLPPGRTFYLVARKAITGIKPEVGESIGKYGADSYAEASSITTQRIGSPPPGCARKETPRVIADSIPISGSKGEVISGVKIVMYKMPDQNELRSENMRLAEAPDYETGFAISNLFFAFNSHELDQRSFAELDLWVGFFKGRRDVGIELMGHADSVGSDEYNLQLSRLRAEAVARYLVSKGISPERISVEGYGSSRPIGKNDTEEGRSKNRRVDIKFDK
jgi:outer membrane protein OmpA-like peptidoglycan-associated protein